MSNATYWLRAPKLVTTTGREVLHTGKKVVPMPLFLVVSPYVGCPIWAPHVIDLKVISKFTITRSTAKHYL